MPKVPLPQHGEHEQVRQRPVHIEETFMGCLVRGGLEVIARQLVSILVQHGAGIANGLLVAEGLGLRMRS